ncbi:uncharacterized protein LOC128675959 [Plodia interpunctella]|uniref:uncharacterized protein LOC128675959 n=1 Tax=Plodia interpunctella TaxID=58824 RepID=UPI0023680C2B|nr:uncharacterized protein LOC128675959 [Plodia interpunctella]
MYFKLTLSLLAVLTATAHAGSILDYLNLEETKKLIEVPELRDDQPNRNCLCKGPACVCCVDFNITVVDLGGPGCVHMKYLSPDEGFSVKVSYGKSLLHSSKIQGSNPAPICLEVFGKFAQLCAKFSDLAPTSEGLRGCLELEPRLLGEGQIDFPIGCFKSKEGGQMEMEDPPAEPETTTEEEAEDDSNGNDTSPFDAESFLLNIYKTAEQGVALLGSLLDIPIKSNATKPTQTETTSKTPEPENTQRRAKQIKHPNQL